MHKNKKLVEALDQYDFPWDQDETIFKDKSKYPKAIGDFLVCFSNLESALNLLIVDIINDRAHDLGYQVIKTLTYKAKADLANSLYLSKISCIPNSKLKNKTIGELKLIMGKVIKLNSIRNNIVHANWMTLEKNSRVRVKVTQNDSGRVEFIKTKITPSMILKFANQCNVFANRLYSFPDKVNSRFSIN